MVPVHGLKADAELSDLLNAFAVTVTHFDVYDKVVFRRLLAACEKQQQVDVVSASLNLAFLHNSVGDYDQTARWIRNAELNGGHNPARLVRFLTLVNHGHATEALALADECFAQRGCETVMGIAERLAATGAFVKIVQAVDESQARSEVLVMTNLLETARKAAAVYKVLDVKDADVTAMIDVAGEMMRESRLIWQNYLPDFSVLDAEHGGPSVSIEFRIDVSPQEAVKLGWTLTERIVERGLDRAGVYVDFLGTRLTRPQVA